jgi:hypothetical protein
MSIGFSKVRRHPVGRVPGVAVADQAARHDLVAEFQPSIFLLYDSTFQIIERMEFTLTRGVGEHQHPLDCKPIAARFITNLPGCRTPQGE